MLSVFVSLQRDSIIGDNEYTGNDTTDSRIFQDTARLESMALWLLFVTGVVTGGRFFCYRPCYRPHLQMKEKLTPVSLSICRILAPNSRATRMTSFCLS